MNILQKVTRWMYSKATGFPPWGGGMWNAAGPWPSCVVAGFAGNIGAMQLATVYGCVRVRGQTLGSLPFYVYRQNDDGSREKAADHWLYPLLHDSPNRYQTSFEWRECMERSFCLWGNAYSEIARVGKRVVALNYLNPEAITARWDLQKGLIFTYSWMGTYKVYGPEDLLVVKNFSSNGLWGDSPIRSFAINHALEAQDYGRYFLQNMGRPSGYLKFKGKRPANEEANNKLRADWQKIHGGPENAGNTAVLWEEGEYVPIGCPPDDAQYIETRKFSVEEIAGGIFGVPLNLIGHSDKTATFASAEQFAVDYITHTVRPQATRFEQAINKALLALEPTYYCEMDLDALQRGDSAAQSQVFSTLAQNGLASRNELRRKLNFPEMPGADSLTVQSNLVDIETLGEPPEPAEPNAGEQPTTSPPKQRSRYGLKRARPITTRIQ